MGNQLVWQDRFNIGVEFIDREHRKLFSIMNKLFSSNGQEEKGQWVYQEGIKYFKNHAMKHFTEEEVYMASIGYPGFETHRRIHDNFRQKTLPALERELEQTAYSTDAVNLYGSMRRLADRAYIDGRPGNHRKICKQMGGTSAGGRTGGCEKGNHTACE